MAPESNDGQAKYTRPGTRAAVMALLMTALLQQGGFAAQTPQAAAPQPQTSANLDGQIQSFEKKIDSNSLSMPDFEQLVQLADHNPANAKVHLLLGLAFDLQGLSDQAYEQYVLADKYGPNDPQAIVQILQHVLSKGGSNAANPLIASAIKRFPDNAEILFIMGKALKDQGHPAEASKFLEQAWRTGKKVKGLPSLIGEMVISHDPEKAIRFAKQELADNPDFGPALTIMGKALMLQGNYALALQPLSKLYKDKPDYNETTVLYLNSLFWCADYKDALEPALFNLRNDSTYAGGENKPANIVFKVMGHVPAEFTRTTLQNFYSRCEKMQLEILPPFHFFIGKTFFQLHRYGEAKTELLHYYDADAKSAETLWMLGYIAENYDHDYATALDRYRLAHALLPLHPSISASLRQLEERMNTQHSDWAWSLRNWFYSLFSWGH